MPIPRREGASLAQISLVMPGSKGLNKQAENTILGEQWATIATNAVFDTSGRLAARKGWANQTSTPIPGTPIIEQIFELVKLDGTTQIISAGGNKLFLGVSAPSDITGTTTPTANNWQFVNFSGKCIGVQQGAIPIVYDGTTSFAPLAVSDGGTAPTGNCAVVHSGRLWAVDSDQHTIKYSAILDHTKWAAGSGAGSIDMTSVWPQGTDIITALAFYNGHMIVFGRNRIVFFTDGQGSPLGINPNNLIVSDTIVGVGCIARDSVQQIEGGDILFLSAFGVESLQRLVIQKNNPLENVSRNVRDYLIGLAGSADQSKIRSVYYPEGGFYLLSIPSSAACLAFSTLTRLEDGSLRVTEWNNFIPRALCRSLSGTLYASVVFAPGKIGAYSGYRDDGNAYTFSFASGWLQVNEDLANYLKILKVISCFVWLSSSASMSVQWGFDFDPTLFSTTGSLTAPGQSEWGIMQWGIDEWSGGIALREIEFPIAGSGQYLRVGSQSTIDGQSYAIQQFNLFAKIGRLAR